MVLFISDISSMASRSSHHLSNNNILELPSDQAGKIDWNTLGNILTAHLLGQVLFASHVDKLHSQLSDDIQADTDWEFLYEKDNISVLRKPSKKNICFVGRGVVEVPLREVAKFIKDIHSTYLWDKFLVEAKYLKVLSESDYHTDYIGYQRYESTQCFTNFKRDMLYFVRCSFIDGKYVQSAMSIEDDDYPVNPDIKRIQSCIGSGFVLEPHRDDTSATLINYFGNFDMKGKIPALIMSKVMQSHPLCAIQYIRSHYQRTVGHSQLYKSSDQRKLALPSESPKQVVNAARKDSGKTLESEQTSEIENTK